MIKCGRSVGYLDQGEYTYSILKVLIRVISLLLWSCQLTGKKVRASTQKSATVKTIFNVALFQNLFFIMIKMNCQPTKRCLGNRCELSKPIKIISLLPRDVSARVQNRFLFRISNLEKFIFFKVNSHPVEPWRFFFTGQKQALYANLMTQNDCSLSLKYENTRSFTHVGLFTRTQTAKLIKLYFML